MILSNTKRATQAGLDFPTKAAAKHNNKYDYTNVIYVNCKTAVDIICPVHGMFQQIPNSHLLGHGCSKCGHETHRRPDKIIYPRQCEHCDYVARSPSMYQYHNYTHEQVPDGVMCYLGCGQVAQFRNTHGNYTCSKIAHACPGYVTRHSALVQRQWDTNQWEERKTLLRGRALAETTEQREARVAKQVATKRAKFGTLTPEDAITYRRYARFIRERAQRWARKQGYTIGRQTYHVDHKLSIRDAWCARLPEEIVNHPANLHIMEAKKNSGKGPNSSLTVDELLERIKQSNAT